MLDAMVVTLALYGVLYVWFNGSLFNHERAKMEARGWELFLCPICLAVWLTVGLFLVGMFVYWPLQAIAGYGAFTILNQFLPVKKDATKTTAELREAPAAVPAPQLQLTPDFRRALSDSVNPGMAPGAR